MRSRVRATLAGALVLVACCAGAAAAASDPVLKCRQAVLRGAGKLAHVRLASLEKCEKAKRAGKLPAFTSCATEPAVAAALATARAKLDTVVARVCGGSDKQCGGTDDVTLASMQWPSVCPDLEDGGCVAPLASCADVPACVACLADAAVSRGVALVYAPFAFVDPKIERALARCQKALAAGAVALADKRLAVHARCLTQRLDGKHDASCPVPGDGKAAGVLAAARAKVEGKVCKACGGADKRCGGGDDLALELVGVAPACPGVAACGGGLASVADLVACFDCTAAARGECALAGAAPGVVDYPAGCAVVPATPTPTVTPSPTETPVATATVTPSPTLTATPAPTPSPAFCAAAGAGTVTTAVTLTLETGGAPVAGARMLLAYPPARVRIAGIFDDAEVRAHVTDLTAGALLSKGSPNNHDSDGDNEPDRLRFTIVSVEGVAGAILKVTFDRCSGAALTTAGDYACTVVEGKGIAPDGVTDVPATCTLGVVHAP